MNRRNLCKHILGMRNHGGDPSQARIDIENARRPNQPEVEKMSPHNKCRQNFSIVCF